MEFLNLERILNWVAMKRILFLALGLLQISAVFSQRIVFYDKVKYGFKAGLNYTVINFSVPEINTDGYKVIAQDQNNNYTEGMHFGVFTEIGINKKFTFRPEIILSFQNAAFEQNNLLEQDYLGNKTTATFNKTTHLKTTYINIPFLLKYYVLKKTFVVAGLQMGILLAAKSEITGTSSSTTIYNESALSQQVDLTTPETDTTSDYRPVSFGLVLGCGYFLNDNLFAETRYNFGVSNDARSIDYQGVRTDQTSKSSSFQITLGYRF